MNTIYLCEDVHENQHVIRMGEEGNLLRTPGRNLFSSFNSTLIENTIYELQRYDKVEVSETNHLLGEPIESITLYSLYCTEIDFWSDGKSLDREEVISMLNGDPFTNLAPGPEQIDQYHQWRSIINLLSEEKIDFLSIQYHIKKQQEIDRLIDIIFENFDSGLNAQKSIFINLATILRSPIASWALTYKQTSEIALATAFTETGEFVFGIHDMVNEELEKQKPEGVDDDLWEVDEETYDKIYNQKKKDLFNEFLDIFTVCKKFFEFSSKLPPEVSMEESLTHEYKSSFRTPFPDYPSQEVDNSGQSLFKLGNKTFKSKKEINKFIEEQSLKTIVAFLNTKGGTLVIGVNEKDNLKSIVGVDRDDFTSADHYERHIVQQISNRIGKEFLSNYININTSLIQGKNVCIIRCDPFIPKANQVPALLDDDKCYRRTGPRTDEIKSAREFANFVSERIQD